MIIPATSDWCVNTCLLLLDPIGGDLFVSNSIRMGAAARHWVKAGETGYFCAE